MVLLLRVVYIYLMVRKSLSNREEKRNEKEEIYYAFGKGGKH